MADSNAKVGTEPGRIGPRRIAVLGCPVDAMDMEATVDRCRHLIRDGHGAYQVSINALKVELAERDERFADLLWGSAIASADGQSIVWVARLLGQPLPGRVNGTDLMEELLAAAEREGFSTYILGARREVLDRALKAIRGRHPKLMLSGSRDGYFSHSEEVQVVDEIRDSAPDLLFVAMPSPRKEQFIARHIETLNVGLAVGVGGSVDVIAGERARAPRWMQRLGLEWLFRFAQEPRRMWRRYLLGNLRFVLLVVRELISSRRQRR
jgi:N-acetylglucosaminyldiphosphoundecaprenol N-acetyl-beta-D-mannosaminyltransferase